MMDFPAYKRVHVPEDLEGKKHLINEWNHTSVLLNDKSFEGIFKKGIPIKSSDSEDTYIFLDPVSGKKISLRFQDLNWLMVRADLEEEN